MYMKKVIVFVFLLLTICFALPMTHFVTSAYDLNVGNAFVISSKCEVYEEANFDKAKIVTTLKHGDQLEILEIQDKFAKIKKDDIEGYVYKFYLTCNTSQVVYPVFNASLRKDETIYDIEQNPTTFTAKKGTRVYLYDGFKDKEKFTPVQIVLEDGTLYNGYRRCGNSCKNVICNGSYTNAL